MTSKEEETKPADSMIGENSDVVMKQRMTKIAVFNAPRNWDKKRLRKFVEEKNFVDVASVRKVPNKSLGFVGFKTEEAMRKGLEMFRSMRVPGTSTNSKKRKHEDDDDEEEEDELGEDELLPLAIETHLALALACARIRSQCGALSCAWLKGGWR